MNAATIAAYGGMGVGSVASILGAAVLASAWHGEAPKRSGFAAGVGLVLIGATLSIVAGRSLR